MANFFEKSFIQMHVNVYRWSGGRVMGSVGGTPVLLLTTTGRKSGRQRTTPLGYFADGQDYIVVASNGGRPTRPAWYLNLSHTPLVTIQVKDRVMGANAVSVSEGERTALWQQITAAAPAYAPYAAPDRAVPLVRLRVIG